MRARELFLESKQEKSELADLVRKSENTTLLAKLLNYLNVKSKVEKILPNASPVNEDMSNNIKAKVLSMLGELDDDSPEWHKIIDLLRKDEISALANRVIMTKLGAVNGYLDKKLRDMVMRAKFPFEEKEAVLEKLGSGDGYFDGKNFMGNSSGNIYESFDNALARQLAVQMSREFRGEMGYGPDQGPGEMMMIIMGKNIGLATKGDLSIGNKTVEVKATSKGKKGFSGGRLYSTTGYGTSSSIKRDLYQDLLAIGIPEEALLEYGMPTKAAAKEAGVTVKKGSLNLNLSGIENLSNLFQEYNISQEKARTVVKTILDGLYTKLQDGMADPILKLVKSDGSINAQKFLIEMTKLAHVYYMGLAGHDALMIFNTDSGNYAMMQTAEDVGEMLKDGTISLTSHIDLDDDRSKGSSQIIIK